MAAPQEAKQPAISHTHARLWARGEVPVRGGSCSAVDSTNSRPEGITGRTLRVDKQKAGVFTWQNPDSKAGRKLREHGVVLTWVLLWNTKLRSCLYSIQICWLKYLPQVAGLPAAEGLECQGEEFELCHQLHRHYPSIVKAWHRSKRLRVRESIGGLRAQLCP